MHFLPYHTLGINKYHLLNLPYEHRKNHFRCAELLDFAPPHACQGLATYEVATVTTLELDTLSDRIKAHKNALVHLETASLYRARGALRCIDNISISRIRCVAALALAPITWANRAIWMGPDELIIWQQASEPHAPISHLLLVIERTDNLADRPGAGFADGTRQTRSA